MSLRPRTKTELQAIIRDELASFLRVVRERIEMAQVHGYQPDLGGTLIDTYADETETRIERLIETEEGI